MSYIVHSKSQSLGQNPKVVTIGGRTRVSLVDSFPNTYVILSGQTSPDGFWRTEYANGSGAGVQNASGYGNVMYSQPAISTSGTGLESNRNLVLSTVKFTDFDMTVDMRTRQQIRQNFPPFNWEHAHFIWRYTDSTHYYYFVLKNEASEFGKYDTAQIIINTGAPTGEDLYSGSTSGLRFEAIRIRSEGKRHSIYVDGNLVIDYNDTGTSGATPAMADGKVGMYTEDAFSEWKNFSLYGL